MATVGVNGRLAGQWRAGQLTATIGDHLVDIHVELRAATGHPYMQRELEFMCHMSYNLRV